MCISEHQVRSNHRLLLTDVRDKRDGNVRVASSERTHRSPLVARAAAHPLLERNIAAT